MKYLTPTTKKASLISALIISSLLATHLLFKPSAIILGAKFDITESSIISMTNLTRLEHGVHALTPSKQLSTAAQKKARHMVESDYWSHEFNDYNPTWQFILDQNYSYSIAGENLAKEFTSTDDLIKAWLNSPPHRNNLLSSDYSDIGISVEAIDGTSDYLIVQLFASPHSDSTTEINPPRNTSTTPLLQKFNPPNSLLLLIALILIFLTLLVRYTNIHSKKPIIKTSLWGK